MQFSATNASNLLVTGVPQGSILGPAYILYFGLFLIKSLQ